MRSMNPFVKRNPNLANKWVQKSAGIHQSVLKPHQVKQKSCSEVKEIQTHTFPWLESLRPAEQMCGESSAPPTDSARSIGGTKIQRHIFFSWIDSLLSFSSGIRLWSLCKREFEYVNCLFQPLGEHEADISHAPLNCGKTSVPHGGCRGRGGDDDTAYLILVKWK